MRRFFIILFTLLTAGIHFYFFSSGPGFVFSGLDTLYALFFFNGIGYLVLLGLLYLPLGLPENLHRLVRPVFMGYTALTIILYLIFASIDGIWSVPLAPIAKVAEVLLIWQLWTEGRALAPIATQQKSETML
jgi:hypothetical protein